jgi:hypothetical protein
MMPRAPTDQAGAGAVFAAGLMLPYVRDADRVAGAR